MLGLGSDTFLWEDTCVQKSEYWLIARSRPIRGDDRWNSNKRNKEKTNKLSDKTYLSIFMFVWGWQTYHSSLTAKKRKSGEKKIVTVWCKLVLKTSSDVLSVLPPYFGATVRQYVNSFTERWIIYLVNSVFNHSPRGESVNFFTRWWKLDVDNSPLSEMFSPISEI